MRILDRVKPWDGKVNFVDENNVILGFDTSDDCCAHGGWFIGPTPDWVPDKEGYEWDKEPKGIVDLAGFLFDPSYFSSPKCTDAATAQFRITNGMEERFITLYNVHNGYYGKGFEFTCPADPSKNMEEYI